MPRLSKLGRLWALGALLILFLAIVSRAETALWLSGAATIALTADLILALPLGRRARAAGLELSWRIPESARGEIIARGAPIRIEGSILMREPSSLRLVGLKPVGPKSIAVDSISPSAELSEGDSARIELSVRALLAGRTVLQGLATRAVSPLGGFEVGLYFPHPLELRASPRALRWRIDDRRSLRRGVMREGSSAARERGLGVELYELREYRPGDPLRSIASVASARRGRLLVRETERPYEEEHLIFLDVGAGMHVGPLGERPLDLAVDGVWTLLDELLERSHRVRLITFGDGALSEWSSEGGVARSRSLKQALLGVFERYDRERIEGGEEEVAALVAEHLRDQEAYFHSLSSAGDRARLASAIRPRVKALLQEPEKADSFDVFLAYCRRYGLELPPKALSPSGARQAELRSLLLNASRRSNLHTIHLFSRLDEIDVERGLAPLLSLDALRGKLTLYTPHPHGRFTRTQRPAESRFAAALRRALEHEHEESIQAAGALFRRYFLSP